MRNEYDIEASERRIAAYIDFLMVSYGVDERGLADLAGIPRQTLTKFMRAENGEKSVGVLFALAEMSGVMPSFLIAEQATAKEVA